MPQIYQKRISFSLHILKNSTFQFSPFSFLAYYCYVCFFLILPKQIFCSLLQIKAYFARGNELLKICFRRFLNQTEGY